ncbi:efflux RND transporter periplasmic adaptor subunit [Halomonas sp. HP20-15]|uniref:efflux RND transporter periplasmic adaptor subunit n=1 Tax=Halomonas sp. HP20-15 TaxID=3085901 RepID=UPI002982787B|nr:efflux RND transporter periplasmic adaptor subunit [Halomonas sp. HP20-15]MDW5376677.1 efflux RND transporter periplasmic adaptor subunit [Halomonas sp. HP20-15]
MALLALAATGVDAAESPPVIAAHAELRDWTTPLEALGTLRADESVTLSATLTEVVAEIDFSDGQRVEAGQLLVRLDDSEVSADLRAAQAQRAERNNVLQRSVQLEARNLAPRADVEDNRARLHQIEAQIEAIEARLADHRIRAPFAGVVGFRNISPGTLVTPGMALVTLDKLDVVKLDFSVPAVHLAELHPGLALRARTESYPDSVFAGKIDSIGMRIDPVSRSVPVRAVLANPDGHLRPGMLMEIVLDRRPRQALTIPEEALIPQGAKQFVMVIDDDDGNLIARRPVSIGERRAGEVEILEGLQAGDLVVSHGTQRVRDGDTVSLLGINDDDTDIAELLERSRVTRPRDAS